MDIVDELRAWPARGDGTDGMSYHTIGGVMEAGAAEIERLRALVADYEEVQQQHRANVRRLDVALNGDGAAKQASLIDLVAQFERR